MTLNLLVSTDGFFELSTIFENKRSCFNRDKKRNSALNRSNFVFLCHIYLWIK
jgi:hypothetical protein